MLTSFVLITLVAFDTPTKVETKPLEQNRTLTCWRYPKLLVKQVDAHEKGAARLSFVRFEGLAPACEEALAASERVLDDWSGYFAGVFGALVIFDGDDGWNGGVGFAVYDATSGKQVLEDARVGAMSSVKGALRYRRLVSLDCNASTDATCATKAMALTNTKQNLLPLCQKGYAKWLAEFQAQVAKLPCEGECLEGRKEQLDSFRSSNSVLVYEVSVDRATFAITPQPKQPECWLQN
ncbi:MAG: hypothetical protein ABTQ32_18335 [Myxococcaceae bacterium]